jgi:hypothetical protein
MGTGLWKQWAIVGKGQNEQVLHGRNALAKQEATNRRLGTRELHFMYKERNQVELQVQQLLLTDV